MRAVAPGPVFIAADNHDLQGHPDGLEGGLGDGQRQVARIGFNGKRLLLGSMKRVEDLDFPFPAIVPVFSGQDNLVLFGLEHLEDFNGVPAIRRRPEVASIRRIDPIHDDHCPTFGPDGKDGEPRASFDSLLKPLLFAGLDDAPAHKMLGKLGVDVRIGAQVLHQTVPLSFHQNRSELLAARNTSLYLQEVTRKFIGDLSRHDAELLERYASSAHSVLEYGVGGSTQIIAQSLTDGASFLSLDTDSGWITTTGENLRRLGVEDRCRMIRYENWSPDATRFDLIFDDGADHFRRDFALRSFPLLEIGGVILFHDTRRLLDFQNVLALIEVFFEEIEHVHLNERVTGVSSNITAVRKKAKEPYANWNIVENKPPWAYGQGVVPEDFWLK